MRRRSATLDRAAAQLDLRLADPWERDDPTAGEPPVGTAAFTLARPRDERHVSSNLEVIRKLASRQHAIGRAVAIDAAHISLPARVPGRSEEDVRPTTNRPDRSQASSRHQSLRSGYTLTVLTDIETVLPLAWVLAPVHEPETQSARTVIDLLYRHWPDCPIEYLVGDRAFAVPQLRHELADRYGIHLVAPWRKHATMSAHHADLLVLRTAAESVFARLRRSGLAGTSVGSLHARGAQRGLSSRIGSCLLGQTLSYVAREDGRG